MSFVHHCSNTPHEPNNQHHKAFNYLEEDAVPENDSVWLYKKWMQTDLSVKLATYVAIATEEEHGKFRCILSRLLILLRSSLCVSVYN